MTIKELINSNVFCTATEREFIIDDISIKYYCCKKSIDCSKTECISCSEIYARYVLIDLTEYDVRNACENSILESYESFVKFQKDHLSHIFFYENDDVRYNIYLIFLVDSYDEKYDKIERDLNYARKFFFTDSALKEYFCFFDSIDTLIKKNGENDLKVIEVLKDTIKKLHAKRNKSILLKPNSERGYSNFDYLKNGSFDSFNNINMNSKEFFEKFIYDDSFVKIDNKYNVKQIKDILLSNFRTDCFKQNFKIKCGKVNIIYGENTVGKTSILDAIEFGFTGKVHKDKDNAIYETSSVTLEGTIENTAVSSEEAMKNKKQLKQIWYKYKIGSLSELFCRINYFDTDATYRFALEEGKEQIAFLHLKKLLCNAKLIELAENLNNHIIMFDEIKEFFEHILKQRKNNTKQRITLKDRFLYHVFKDSIYSTSKEDYYEKRINQYKNSIDSIEIIENECKETLRTINQLIDEQIKLSVELINRIFHRLYPDDQEIKWVNECFELDNKKTNNNVTISAMSTAQKVCLALSVIFTQFFISNDAPRIILLDESVANFDYYHLLNLCDFLRDAALNGVQIFFATASEEVARIAKNKYGFLKEDFYLYKLDRDKNSKTKMYRLTPETKDSK